MGLLTPDPGTLFWMVIIFGIVFFILAKYAFPVITGMVDKRKQYIDSSLEAARQANDIRRQVAILSVDVAEKVLRKKLSDDKEQLELVNRLLDEVKSNNDIE